MGRREYGLQSARWMTGASVFEALVLPHLDAAYRFARWLSRSPGDADDVVQEAVLRAFRGFDALRGSDVKAWLLTHRHDAFT